MTLASFDVSLIETSQKSKFIAKDPAQAAAIIGLDRVLVAAARELYGSIADPFMDLRRGKENELFEVDYGFRLNLGVFRRAQLSADSFLTDPQPWIVLDALGLREQDLADPSEGEREEGTLNGLLPLLLTLGARPIDHVHIIGNVVDVCAGDRCYRISFPAYRLLRSRQVREGLNQIAEALGYAHLKKISFTSRTTGNLILELNPQDILALKNPLESSVELVNEVRTMALTIKQDDFRQQKGWTLFDGVQTLLVKMSDQAFMKLVDNGLVALHTGAILVVNARIKTTQTSQGLLTSYEIVKVVDYQLPELHYPMPGL